MSNSLAIAAVTATLRNLLMRVSQPLLNDPESDAELADAVCSAKPPDKARASEDRNQLNLFLYQTTPNPALRNTELLRHARPGEVAMPPVALNLYYLVTAYGRNFDDILSHRLMGRAMTLLHDNSPLMANELEKALAGNDLAQQPERIRITPHALTAEEISKLWTVFQTPYRLSTAYEVSVILLQSSRPTRTAPPVIARGSDGRGPVVLPDLKPKVPTLETLVLPMPRQPAARLAFISSSPPVNLPADKIKFVGSDLSGTVTLKLSHPLFKTPLSLSPDPGVTDPPPQSGFIVTLPDNQLDFPAGLYTVSASIDRGLQHPLTTNSLGVAIAPRIVDLPNAVTRDAAGSVTFNLKVSPSVWKAQRVTLLVGATEYSAAPRSGDKTDQLTFVCDDMSAGKFPVRLRVDGVDSLLIKYDADPLQYDPQAVVNVS